MYLHTLHEPGFSRDSYLRVTPHNHVNLNLSVFCKVLRKLCQPYNSGEKKKILLLRMATTDQIYVKQQATCHLCVASLLIYCWHDLLFLYQETKLTTCSNTLRRSIGMPTKRTSNHYVNLPCYVAFTRKLIHVLLTATFHDWTCNKSHVSVTIRINYKTENYETKDKIIPHTSLIITMMMQPSTWNSQINEWDISVCWW
jgi:hypothetical protein